MTDLTSWAQMALGGGVVFGFAGWMWSLTNRIDTLFTIVAGVSYEEHKRRNGGG